MRFLILTCTAGLLSGIVEWDVTSVHHPQIPRPRNPIRAYQDCTTFLRGRPCGPSCCRGSELQGVWSIISTSQHERTRSMRARRCTVTQQHCSAGVVMDTNNTPLEGVSVKIYRLSYRQIERIGYARTEANGQYVADFDAGSPVIVRYDHFPGGLDDCHPAIISHLSGASNHTVSVVMYMTGRH